MHGRVTRRGMAWRVWVVALAVALIGATSMSAVWHGDHEVDQDCAVCQLRHQPAADLSVTPTLGHAPVPHHLVVSSVTQWAASHLGSSVPARAPPA